uniref:DUF4774 domain-containing protein n=1 Tax=Glossina palpalis gambiensis TaxID=67801 RepID=A0A1B0B976_9MUSC
MDDMDVIPYYGGMRGQYLQIKDGKIHDIINKSRENSTQHVDKKGTPASLDGNVTSAFEHDFNKIQLAAARLVAIQEQAKRKGSFSAEENRVYAISLLELGKAAQNLATLQQTGQIKDFSVLLQPYHMINAMPQKSPTTDNMNHYANIEAVIEEQKDDSITTSPFSSGTDLLPTTAEDPYEDNNDSIAIMSPKKDASGGVASAKPNAVALSGRNGLAVSAPKATAIAGVTPEEAAAFSVSVPSRNQILIKTSGPRFPPLSPNFDYYDYIESSPIQASPYSHEMSPTYKHNFFKYNSKPISTINVASSMLKMWRTALAEDYANSDATGERNADIEIKKHLKVKPQ